MQNKVYLGDSVYVSNDGFHIIIETNNGDGPKNIVYLYDSVFLQLMAYGKKVFGMEQKNETPDL